MNPFIVISNGRPFNIVNGRDTNGDGLFTERPAFAMAQTDPANLKRTRFGDFDLIAFTRPVPGVPLLSTPGFMLSCAPRTNPVAIALGTDRSPQTARINS